jgi:hypothetical protein
VGSKGRCYEEDDGQNREQPWEGHRFTWSGMRAHAVLTDGWVGKLPCRTGARFSHVPNSALLPRPKLGTGGTRFA